MVQESLLDWGLLESAYSPATAGGGTIGDAIGMVAGRPSTTKALSRIAEASWIAPQAGVISIRRKWITVTILMAGARVAELPVAGRRVAELRVGMGCLVRPAACMRRPQGIPAAPAGLAMEVLAMEELREPIPSSIAAVPTEGVFMEGDPAEGTVEAMEAGTGDRMCAGA
jgi:hypothetical protein